MRTLLYTLSILAVTFTAQAQTKQSNRTAETDSIYTIWQDESLPDSTRVKVYYEYIFNHFLFSNPDSALVLAADLLNYANKDYYPKSIALAYKLQGIVSYFKSDYPSALEYYEKSLAIFEKIADKKEIAANLANKGIIYNNQGDFTRAFEAYERSLVIREEIGDKKGISGSLGNIGIIYNRQGNYPRALEYYEKSLAIKEEIGDKNGVATTMHNIGGIYLSQGNLPRALEYFTKSLVLMESIGYSAGIGSNLNNIASIYRKQGERSLALEYFVKSLKFEEQIGDKRSRAMVLSNIGNVHSDNGNYSLALEYFQKCLAIGKEIDDKLLISASFINIGKDHQKLGKTTLALDYCERGLEITKEFQLLEQQKLAYECLYDAYKAKGKGNEALENYEKLITVRDSLYNEENTKKLVQIDMQYQFDRKEAVAKAEQEKKDAIALQELKRQKMTRNGFMAGFAVTLLFAGVFFMQRNKIGKEKQRSEELLHNILPEEIALELKEKGKADARDFDMVSIIFTDFKGFTEQSAKLSASELVNEINHCFEAFDHIIGRYGIEKIKTIGDAYMAAGGVPTPTDDSAKNTVLAALEMQTFVSKRKAENDAANKPAFEMRVGIHTGPVVAGIVGVKKFQYDIWGDTVNTASRIESNGQVGKVNVSQATYQLLKDDADFVFESRGKIEAKGKGKIEMYFVGQPPIQG